MTCIRIYNPEEGFREETDLKVLPNLLADEKNIVWAALDQPADEDIAFLTRTLQLHPLAVEDLRENGERPRMRRNGDNLSIVFYAVKCTPDAEDPWSFVRVNLVVCQRTLVTVTHEKLAELDEAETAWHGNVDNLPRDAGGPLYAVLDTLIDDFFPIIDAIADQVDDVEDQVVEQHAHASLALIFRLKKTMLRFRRIASGSRDVVNVLLRHDDLFGPESSIFFQDLYDHTVRVTDSIDTYRDLLGNAMDTYLSVTSNNLAESSNRLNVIMQTLTSWSIILGSGTFIAGIYGMNVHGLPLATGRFSFAFVTGLCLVIAALLFALFRRRRWV